MKNPETVKKVIKTKQKNGSFDNRTMSQEAKEKISLANAKKWKIIFPNGDTKTISNLLKFCRENNLNNGHMNCIAKGLRKTHKGFKCKSL